METRIVAEEMKVWKLSTGKKPPPELLGLIIPYFYIYNYPVD